MMAVNKKVGDDFFAGLDAMKYVRDNPRLRGIYVIQVLLVDFASFNRRGNAFVVHFNRFTAIVDDATREFDIELELVSHVEVDFMSTPTAWTRYCLFRFIKCKRSHPRTHG